MKLDRLLAMLFVLIFGPALLDGCCANAKKEKVVSMKETAAAEPVPATARIVALSSPSFAGRLLDNVANHGRQGSGFSPLCLQCYPGKDLYRDDLVGINFEHVFNGMAADREQSKSTPRKDPCILTARSRNEALLRWPAEGSSWGLECEMRYSLKKPGAVDLEFSVTPTKDRFALGYVALMWASYMNHARDRRIYFPGTDGERDGWMSFGDDKPDGFETGTVAASGVDHLPYEQGAQTLNLIEHPSKRFLEPFYYGLLDGDHDLTTTNDTLAYIVMFDQRESVRFALWNFITDSSGQADTHSPAWDWQFVIREPRITKTYGYRARILVKPFTGPDAIRAEYQRWSKKITAHE
jgi:hypothetical protein